MCGIAGFWDYNHRHGGDLKSVIKNMTDAIENRGPDAEGFHIEPELGLALGHRRLSIIDLSEKGSQPMRSHSKRWTIVYNGEVYNYKELPTYQPGDSDTRVILEMFDHYGLDQTLPQLNGMFAFCLFDHQDRVMYLVRDRMGVKPLYYGTTNDGAIVFGSTLHAIRGCKFFKGEINPHARPIFLTYNCLPEDVCIYQDIYKVKPGTYVKITSSSKDIITYYSLYDVAESGSKNPITDYQDAKAQLHAVLKDAVSKRMISDVPIGAFLSGGIDSSLVVALMQSQSTKPVSTFSIGFDNPKYNEAPYAKAIAQHLGTHHTEEYLSSRHVIDMIPRISDFYDEPFADSSQIPTFLVSQIAKKHVTVSLSGDGGDELFGGYNRYIFSQKIFNKLSFFPLFIRQIISHLLKIPSVECYDRLCGWVPKCPNMFGEKVHKLSSLLTSRTLLDFYEKCTYVQQNHKGHHQLPPYPPSLSHLQMMEFYDMFRYLPSDILTKVDRASMAVSLESREPLLDVRLVDMSFRIPDRMKIQNGSGKLILKDILSDYVPKTLFERPKMGFGIPVGEFLKNELKDWAEDLLEPNYLESQGFNVSDVRSMWANHLKKKGDYQHILWGILMWQNWRKKIKNG
jgi:asparagine synthase (glutamine-hydrolysing)